jgi:hypothetical protein
MQPKALHGLAKTATGTQHTLSGKTLCSMLTPSTLAGLFLRLVRMVSAICGGDTSTIGTVLHATACKFESRAWP